MFYAIVSCLWKLPVSPLHSKNITNADFMLRLYLLELNQTFISIMFSPIDLGFEKENNKGKFRSQNNTRSALCSLTSWTRRSVTVVILGWKYFCHIYILSSENCFLDVVQIPDVQYLDGGMQRENCAEHTLSRSLPSFTS